MCRDWNNRLHFHGSWQPQWTWLLLVGVFLWVGLPSLAHAQNQPDLFIGSFLVTPTVGPPGGPVDLSFELRNGGQADAGPFNVSIYFSLTSTLDVQQAVLLKTLAISGLNVGQTDVQRISVSIPKTALINNVGYLVVWVDSGQTIQESNESNNITTATFNVKPGPDLTVDQLSVSRTTPVPGESITLSYRMRNVGRADARPFYIYVYVSSDPLIDSQDTRLTSTQIQTLRANQDITTQVSIQIPTTAQLNTDYYVGVVIDAREEEIEEDENNNISTLKIHVIPPTPQTYPDFIITAMTLHDQTKPIGENASLDVTVKNQGTADGYADVYVYYALTSRFLVQTSYRLVYRHFLKVGESHTFTGLQFQVPWRSPFDKTPQDYVVKTTIHSGTELSSTNNDSPVFTLRATQGKSTLGISSVSFSPLLCNYLLDGNNKIVQSTPITGTIGISNNGWEPGVPFRVGIYASTDTTITSSDILLGTVDIASVAPQTTYDKNYSFTMVATVPPGTYYLGALLDIRNEIQNDYGTGRKSYIFHSRTIKFSRTMPDLVVDSLVVTPSQQADAGTNITIEATIKNASAEAIDPNCHHYYTNVLFAFWDDAQLQFPRYTTAQSVYGITTSTTKVTATLSIPTGIGSMSGFLGIKVDADNIHQESNESNNTKVIPYKLAPREFDFEITSATISDTTLVWEKSSQIDIKIVNKGTLTNNYNVSICAWFSYNKTKEVQDVHLGTAYARNYSTPPLNEGSLTFTTDRWLPGDAYILLQVNCGSYPETNDSNNWYVLPVKVRKFDVDFVVTKISASPNYIRPSDTTEIQVEVENKGLDKHIKNTAVCIYFSDDNVFDTKDQRYMCRETSDILAGKGIAKLSITGDRSLVAGKRYIIAQLDTGIRGPYCGTGCWYAHPTYEETNENNNLGYLPIDVINDVDLTTGSLSVSKTLVVIGENLIFRFQVKNVGSVSTNLPFDVWAVFSDDPRIDDKDRLIQKIRLPTLDAGQTSSDFTVSYPITNSIQPGERYIGLLIDPDNEVKEPDEGNNSGSVQINVLIPGIDLQIRAASVDNDVVPAGQQAQVQVYAEIQNFGTNPSPAFEIGYYLSTDDKFDASDTLLVSRNYTQPLASTAKTGQFVDKVALTLTSSFNYYILVVVDPRNQIAEALETNNVLAIPLKVVNRPPTITSLAVTQATEKQAYSYDAKAYDPDNDPLTWSLVKAPLGMLIDAKTGQVTWVPQPFQGGQSFDVTLEVSDGRGGVATQTYRVAVQSVNDPPKIVSTPPTRTLAGTQWIYTARAIDPDPNDSIRWLVVNAPAGLTIDVNSGLVSWSVPANLANQNVTISIKAEDLSQASDTQTFTVFVAPLNQAPKITSTANTQAFSGVLYSYMAQATDLDTGDTLTWSRVSGPTGLTIEPATGQVEWKVPIGMVGVQIPVTIRVRDQIGAYDEQTFLLDVRKKNTPPTITSTPPKHALLGVDLTYSPTAADLDPGDTLSWSLTKGPVGVQFNAVTGQITWRPSQSDVGQKVSFGLSVADAEGAKDTQTFEVLVKVRCEVDSDCPTDAICTQGLCEEPGCYKAGCSSPSPVCTEDATCGTHRCAQITCPADQFCRHGTCIVSCLGVKCPSGQRCVDGQCVVDLCVSLSCPQGQRCTQGQCLRDPCFTGTCRYTRICTQGTCQGNPCLQIQCPSGAICTEGQCHSPRSCRIDIDCPYQQICVSGSCAEPGCLDTSQTCSSGLLCIQRQCTQDPCRGISCAKGQFCRNGQCIAGCAGISCAANQFCRDGQCVSDPCASVSCKAGEVCVAGQCEQNICIAGRSCKHGRVCTQNACVDDLCRLLTCPLTTQQCVLGQCLDPPACVLDHECASQQLCVKGQCLAPSCSPSQTCNAGEICIDGACTSQGCKPSTCHADQVCRAGQCEKTCAGIFCKPDEECRAGACVTNPCWQKQCQSGEICHEGQCVQHRCAKHPNPCKQGRICTPTACLDNSCLQISCPAGQLCESQTGQCTSQIPCKVDSTCPAGTICERGFCGPPGCYLQTCASETLCRQGQCIVDPCKASNCSQDQYCAKDGSCRWSCRCPKGQRCGLQGCEVDPCSAVQCSAQQECLQGICEDKCPDQACRYHRICVPGPRCIDDPCMGLTCPDGTACRNGSSVDLCMEQSCPDGLICQKGQCITAPQEPAPPEISDAADGVWSEKIQRENIQPESFPSPEGNNIDTPESLDLPKGCQCQSRPTPWGILWISCLVFFLLTGFLRGRPSVTQG